ncbi:hypothetical protein SMICM304S_10761 [Streptomyces microflavus]
MPGHRPQRDAGARGEAVGERAPEVQRGPVAAEHQREALQMLAQPRPVPGRRVLVARQISVQQRIEVQRPAVVVVEGAPVPVGVPAVAPVPGLQQLQRPLPRTSGLRVTPAHRLQEPGDGVREEVPVVARRKVAQRTSQPVLRPVLHPGLQPVPEPGPGEPQPECDGGGLHHRLPLHMVVQDEGPGLRVVPPGCTCPGSEPAPVAFQPFVRVLPLGPGDPEGGRQERPRVPLQPVGAHSGVRRGPRQVEQRPAGGGPPPGGVQQPVGGGLPVRSGVPGVRARRPVLRGEFERGGREGRHTGRPGPSWWTRSAPEILIERSQAVKRTTRRRPKRSNDQGVRPTGSPG